VTQKVIDPNTGREMAVSDSAVRNAVESEQAIYKATREGPSKVRAFDVIDRTWTGLISPNFVHQHYLHKVVFKCSACNFTTSRQNQIGQHVRSVFTAHKTHVNAVLSTHAEGGSTWQECSGCGGRFRIGRMAGEKHLESIRTAPPAHVGAEELTVKRFALEPSEPVVMGRQSISIDESLIVMEPEAKVMRSSRRRQRSRRRRVRNR
jgi:hypothetical protein